MRFDLLRVMVAGLCLVASACDPHITSVTPDPGTAGQQATISGTNLMPPAGKTLSVVYDGSPIQIVSSSPTAIQVVLPTGKPTGIYSVYVAVDADLYGPYLHALVSSCVDECPSEGAVECGAGGERVCGQFDGDECLEWSAASTCDDGELCTADSCVAGTGCTHQPAGEVCPGGTGWIVSDQNPVLTPSASSPVQGDDNVYAPDVVRVGTEWWMYYGGQSGDGHDQMFLAVSDDLLTWRKHPSWASPAPVIANGSANHVNDPSVVRDPVVGTWYLFYTLAQTAENDEIWRATSSDGITWTDQTPVLHVDPAIPWESLKVGRPSVLYEEGEFRMWYDGQNSSGARHVGYATSPDGLTWTRYAHNPVVLNAGAVDVDRQGSLYVMVAESHQGTLAWVSQDRVSWQYQGMLFGLSGRPWDAFGQVTPNLLTQNGAVRAILFGGASHVSWAKNRIGIAFPGSDEPGCAQCVVGAAGCQEACEGAGQSGGTCGNPGSVDPARCCACDPAPAP